MEGDTKNIELMHIWDARVNSGANIDDRLAHLFPTQVSISRVLVKSGQQTTFSQKSLHILTQLKSPYPANKVERQISKMRFKRLLRTEIRQNRPDVIFFHFGQTAATLIKPLRRFNIPYVIAFYGHDISVALGQKRWIRKYQVFSTANAKFLVLSEGVKRRVVSLGIDPEKISIYNYPLDLSSYLDVRKVRNRESFNITIPGRLVEKKGHLILFQALQHLKNSGVEIKLNVLGYGDKWSDFKLKADELGISGQINWIDSAAATVGGNFDSMYCSILEQTDLVVLPCLTSSTGDDEAGPALVLCLAQASATPVLTTPFEGHEVSISHNETGFLCHEGDPVDLARMISWCIDHPREVKVVSECGKVHVQRVFNQDTNLGIVRDAIRIQANAKQK